MPNNLIKLNSWFICDNCKEKIFVRNGKYDLDNSSFCIDCVESIDNEFNVAEMFNKINNLVAE